MLLTRANAKERVALRPTFTILPRRQSPQAAGSSAEMGLGLASEPDGGLTGHVSFDRSGTGKDGELSCSIVRAREPRRGP
jgi:hypothetical protein